MPDNATSHRAATPRLLDLFCGAGGAAVGYHRAGFDVVGVDIKPQPRYPFTFWQEDAMDILSDPKTISDVYQAVHASPPCQAYTKAQRIQKREHPDLIAPVRELLRAIGLPYVIENVPGSPLIDPIVLEGQMFTDVRTHRPRWFECGFPVEDGFLRAPLAVRQAKMGRVPVEDEWMQIVGHFSNVKLARKAMGIDWMTRDELREAIPPAYTEWIGQRLMEHLRAKVAA